MEALEVGKEVNAHSINAYYDNLSAETVKKIHDAGFKIYAWTVNNHVDIRKLLDLGIDGFITNYPDRVLSIASE